MLPSVFPSVLNSIFPPQNICCASSKSDSDELVMLVSADLRCITNFLQRASDNKDAQTCPSSAECQAAASVCTGAAWQWYKSGRELHIITNTTMGFPPPLQTWWTAGQTEAVPCGDISRATAPRLPAHLFCLHLASVKHHSGEILAHMQTHTHTHAPHNALMYPRTWKCLIQPLIWCIALTSKGNSGRVEKDLWVTLSGPSEIASVSLWW